MSDHEEEVNLEEHEGGGEEEEQQVEEPTPPPPPAKRAPAKQAQAVQKCAYVFDQRSQHIGSTCGEINGKKATVGSYCKTHAQIMEKRARAQPKVASGPAPAKRKAPARQQQDEEESNERQPITVSVTDWASMVGFDSPDEKASDASFKKRHEKPVPAAKKAPVKKAPAKKAAVEEEVPEDEPVAEEEPEEKAPPPPPAKAAPKKSRLAVSKTAGAAEEVKAPAVEPSPAKQAPAMGGFDPSAYAR